MIEEIKTEVKERVEHTKWADSKTKEFLKDKLDNLVSQVGYPEWYNNQTELIERYEEV